MALDCDNTLWHGVVGEDGIDGIEITSAFASLQRFAIKAHSLGILVCLLSKNNERDVLEVFERRQDMLLTVEHVVAHRINWQPKPQNIASLASQLNLGLDSFVFIDDNPVECAAMRAELPQVVTLQLPAESQIGSFLSNLWAFDKIAITDEDLRRTELYKQEVARHAFESEATSISDFIASLEVEVDIRGPNEKEWPRLAQLTQRTNQFNFTTKRRTEAELRSIASENVLRVSVKDRFGDYGLVGLVIMAVQKDILSVDTFLLSCRVLGRGVEHAIIRELGIIAKSRQLSIVAVNFMATAKNEPAHAFIESVASQFRIQENQILVYHIPSPDAALITHRPGFDPDAIIAASKQSEKTTVAVSNIPDLSDRYTRIALELSSGAAINASIVAASSRPRTLLSQTTPPTNEVERNLLNLWEVLLGVRGLGIDDDYFALGGSSLVAVSLFASISRQFGCTLPLTTILSSPTVRTLGQQIVSQEETSLEPLVRLKVGSPNVGSPRFLFLVHDGDGETLLYSNVARRLPHDLTVVGINPRRAPGIPLAHTSIEDMASFYISRMRTKQPHGPYTLGGMCAGGVIAYEMASQLVRGGERVEYVFLLDAATPQAPRRRFLSTKERLNSFAQVIKAPESEDVGHWSSALFLMSAASRKGWNFLRWVAKDKIQKTSVRLRFRLLQFLLSHQKSWPRGISPLTVRDIYERAEAGYFPNPVSDTNVVLVRASKGDAGDRPYAELYSDATFGWRTVAPHLTSLDVEGGHYTMLQEPHVERLAQALEVFFSSRSKVNGTNLPVNEPA